MSARIIRTVWLLVIIATASCGRSVRRCEVMRLRITDPHVVQDSYSRWSYFTDSCPSAPPKDIQIQAAEYNIRVHMMANESPTAFIGVIPHGSARFELVGGKLRKDTPPSAYGDWATHAIRLSQSSKFDRFDFDVANHASGLTTHHSYNFTVDECTCKGYDRP
jgi:hypothetical protein